jgi:hypothetical protein
LYATGDGGAHWRLVAGALFRGAVVFLAARDGVE